MEVSFFRGEILKEDNIRIKDSGLFFLILILIYFLIFGLRVMDWCDITCDSHKPSHDHVKSPRIIMLYYISTIYNTHTL